MEIRNIGVSHQILCINEIDFHKKSISGYTELTIVPIADEVHIINLNCKQARIYSIILNGKYEAEFEYYDPTKKVIVDGDNEDKRDLQTLFTQQELAILSVDADEGNGELTIQIPYECQKILKEQKNLKVAIEFIIDDDEGGLNFIARENINDCFLFTTNHNASIWFPCVQSSNELCTWKIEVTVCKDHMAISSGDLIEKVADKDDKQIFHYFLSTPTSALNIGLVVGTFDSINDENMNEISTFCEPKLISLINHTTCFVHEVFEFLEDYLSTTYPYTTYKQVFINNAYDDIISYSTMSIFNVNLLHSNTIIDQTFETRKSLVLAISKQFFGCFINYQTYSDWWLVNGISTYLASLYYKKAFGNNEFKYQIYSYLKEICSFEKANGYICLDFKTEGKEMNFSISASLNSSSSSANSGGSTKYNYSIKHPLMLSSSLKRIADKKSFLVFRAIEDAIGNDVLLQVLNKQLSSAAQASNQKYEEKQWSNLILSTESFQKQVSSVSSKDIKSVVDQWVIRGGYIRFNVSSTYNRKRNCLELEVKQDNLVQTKAAFSRYKYVGPLTVVVQELDGSFSHTIQLEENQIRYDIVLHSKAKRSKKKKIPLSNGEEIDIDLNQYNDTDSPILWLRVDPEMKLIREIEIKQEGYQWQMELKYERDICAQLDAITKLKSFQAKDTRDLLTSIIENHEMYYHVRIEAAHLLAEQSNGQLQLLQTFKKFFMFSNSQKLVKQNNFNDLQLYFMQKSLPVAIGKLRNTHNMCPNDVITFLIDLLHFNENGKNRFSDCYYKAALIEALNETLSSTAVAATNLDYVKSLNSNTELRSVIEEIVLRLNLEKFTPSYHYVITSSCLKALRNLQKLGHLPENINIFKQYTRYGTFEEVRKCAFEIIVRFFEVRHDEDLMNFLLNFVQNDPSKYIRHYILQLLCKYPPFRPNSDITSLNSQRLNEKLWKLIKEKSFDYRLRSDLTEFYHVLYGLGKPKCVYMATQETIMYHDSFEPLKL